MERKDLENGIDGFDCLWALRFCEFAVLKFGAANENHPLGHSAVRFGI